MTMKNTNTALKAFGGDLASHCLESSAILNIFHQFNYAIPL